MSREWNPDDVKEALDAELMVHEDRDHATVSVRKLKESVALITDRLIHIALYSDNEPLAAKVGINILDRVHGRPTDLPTRGKGEDDLEKLVRELHDTAKAN